MIYLEIIGYGILTLLTFMFLSKYEEDEATCIVTSFVPALLLIILRL